MKLLLTSCMVMVMRNCIQQQKSIWKLWSELCYYQTVVSTHAATGGVIGPCGWTRGCQALSGENGCHPFPPCAHNVEKDVLLYLADREVQQVPHFAERIVDLTKCSTPNKVRRNNNCDKADLNDLKRTSLCFIVQSSFSHS